jgi:hypothetical protein
MMNSIAMEVEDHQVHTDHLQWAATVVEEGVDVRLHRAEDGEDGAEEGAEEGEEVVTLVIGRARTQGREAGHHEEACHGHHTAVHRREHRRAGEVVEVDTVGEIHRPQEEDEVVVEEEEEEEGARVTIRTIAHDPGAGAGAGTEDRNIPFLPRVPL